MFIPIPHRKKACAMKKLFSLLLILALIFCCSAASFAADDDISVILDGKEIYMDVQPILQGGRVFVPMRAIFEAMGMTVEWNENTQCVIGKKGLEKLVLQNGNPRLYINDHISNLDTSPFIKDGRLSVPVRAVAEGMNATVEWIDGDVIITSNTTGYAEYPFAPDFGKMFNCTESEQKISETETSGLLSAAYTHTYKRPGSLAEKSTAYKEALVNAGYELAKTGEESGQIINVYQNKSDGSFASFSTYKDSLCVVQIHVPVSLQDLNLKTTK